MDEPVTEQPKSGFSKKTIAIIIGLLLIIGGAVSAYVLLDKSTKEKYFLAEKETIDFIGESVKEKYTLESKWGEKTADNPNKAAHRINLQANNNGLDGENFGAVDPFDMLSSVTVLFDVESDLDNKELAFGLGVDFANMDLGKIGATISEHDLFIELPFTDDIIHIEDQQLNELLQELDPYTFTEEDFVDFETIFDAFSNEFLDEEDMEYLKEEYVEYLYEEIPEEAFSEEKDSVTVHGEDINANKITFHLDEDEFKDLLEGFFRKLSRDDRVKDMFEKFIELQLPVNTALDDSISSENQMIINEILDDFERTLKTIRLGIPQLHFKDGMTSTIWVDHNKVVQRDFSLEFGPDQNDLVFVSIEGTQLLETDKQQFDMDVTFGDTYEEFPIHLEGEFNWKDNQGDDYVLLRAEDTEISYEASEELTDKSTKEFTRSIHITDIYADLEFNWSGDASYESEEMNSSHTLSFFEDGVEEEFQIHVDKIGSIEKELDIPSTSDSVQLGEMEMFEIDMYIESLASEFEHWLSQMMGGGMFGF